MTHAIQFEHTTQTEELSKSHKSWATWRNSSLSSTRTKTKDEMSERVTEFMCKHSTHDSRVSHGGRRRDASDKRQKSWVRRSNSVCSLLISGGSLSSWHHVRVSRTQKLTAGAAAPRQRDSPLQSQWCGSYIPSVQRRYALTASDPRYVGVVDLVLFHTFFLLASILLQGGRGVNSSLSSLAALPASCFLQPYLICPSRHSSRIILSHLLVFLQVKNGGVVERHDSVPKTKAHICHTRQQLTSNQLFLLNIHCRTAPKQEIETK